MYSGCVAGVVERVDEVQQQERRQESDNYEGDCSDRAFVAEEWARGCCTCGSGNISDIIIECVCSCKQRQRVSECTVVACVLLRGRSGGVRGVDNLRAAARWNCSLIFAKDETALRRDRREVKI